MAKINIGREEEYRDSNFKLHNGLSSVLLVLIIMALISFATLSIASANADLKLTRKMMERTDGYYAATKAAENKLAAIDETLQSLYESAEDAEAYFASAGKGSTFTQHISETQNLVITITYLYPEKEGDTFYRIDQWTVETDTDKLDYNEDLPVVK